MKSITASSLSISSALAVCLFASAGINAQSFSQDEQQMLPVEEIDERMNLYKRIRLEQNKKALMQLLHDIADIQKQCKDKGYLCSVESDDGLELPLLIDLNQPTQPVDDALPISPSHHTAAANFNLLGIVGNRARFELADGQVKDFSLGEFVADLWKVAEISSEAALLVHKDQPETKARYQIHAPPRYKDANTTASRR